VCPGQRPWNRSSSIDVRRTCGLTLHPVARRVAMPFRTSPGFFQIAQDEGGRRHEQGAVRAVSAISTYHRPQRARVGGPCQVPIVHAPTRNTRTMVVSSSCSTRPVSVVQAFQGGRRRSAGHRRRGASPRLQPREASSAECASGFTFLWSLVLAASVSSVLRMQARIMQARIPCSLFRSRARSRRRRRPLLRCAVAHTSHSCIKALAIE
jgi:hypothetical protein